MNAKKLRMELTPEEASAVWHTLMAPGEYTELPEDRDLRLAVAGRMGRYVVGF